MNFQDIRRYFETPVIECCSDLNVPYRPENTLDPTGDAAAEFVVARLQFGQMSENTVGNCPNPENIRGAFIVEYFGPKGQGPARAQEVMECLFCSLKSTQGVININGPDFTALDDRPYFFSRTSFGIRVPLLSACPEYSFSTATCDCVDGVFYVCGDILDELGVSICDYADPSTFPPGGTVDYDNAAVLNPEDLNKTLEELAAENNCTLI